MVGICNASSLSRWLFTGCCFGFVFFWTGWQDEQYKPYKKFRGCRMKKILLVASICFLAMGGVVSAATIELPRTGQTTCYNASGEEIVCSGTGQDGETQYGAVLPVPRFTTDYYGLTVVDNLTGLMWTFDSRTPDPYDPVRVRPYAHRTRVTCAWLMKRSFI